MRREFLRRGTRSGLGPSSCSDPNSKEPVTSVQVKAGSRKWSSGYYPELCCLLQWVDGEPPPPITSLAFSSKCQL